jgi:phosphate transport system permease protein
MSMSPTSLRARERRRTRREISDEPTRADRLFGAVTGAAGLTVLLLLFLIGLFLLLRSRDAFDVMGWRFFTTVEWDVQSESPSFGVLGLVIGTVLVAIIAVAIAVPLGVCTGLFITDYASPRWRGVLTALVDLLAAIPSLLYGLWGFLLLDEEIVPLSRWISQHFDWMPWFRVDETADYSSTMFIAGIVVSLMVLPIVASITREAFSQTPPGEKEAALALGGTRWGMVRKVVLPFGRGGIVGGAMLGLGRALGETIAVFLLLPQVPKETIRVLQNGGATVSGFIVSRSGGSDLNTSGLMAAGLVLFAMTLLTNMLAAVVISRSRSGAGVEV